MVDSGFDDFVGKWSLTGTYISDKYCKCKNDWFGPVCDTRSEDFKDEGQCGEYGYFDSGNTITGCSCRDSISGNATEYHGWYCERHNRFDKCILIKSD